MTSVEMDVFKCHRVLAAACEHESQPQAEPMPPSLKRLGDTLSRVSMDTFTLTATCTG